jgi:DNA-directed RNA polymerase specialized sigma subunit
LMNGLNAKKTRVKTMARTLDDVIADLPTAEQEAIEARYQEIKAEYVALQDLRKLMNLTQADVAKKLKIPQDNLSRLEKRSDILVSTLREYVEAVGGELHITAKLPNRPPVEITSFYQIAHEQ